MLVTLIILGVLLVGWVLLNLKTSRPDGTYVARVHPYRRMLWHIIPDRDSSVVFYDTYVVADKLLEYVKRARERFHCDLTHVAVGAYGIGVKQTPAMNQFIAGHRIYDRIGNFVTFSMKRTARDAKAKLAAVKLQYKPGPNGDDGPYDETFEELCLRVNAQIGENRSGKRTRDDKEFDLLTKMPRAFLRFGIKLFRWMDDYNILPGGFIKHDAMYTGCFIANLGSIGMNAGYHHLYDWGTCPLFLMIGQLEERPLAIDGQIVIKKVLPLRWTYDERINDGLSTRRGILALNAVLEDPFAYLGCIEPDGSDRFKIGERRVPDALIDL
ncbi:MAG: 2-oxo acid dehydrogenase subunit E2 [Deltaproteobacteria bacterium]|nr:2-oxo acid dehydrogenase subunit E2 [Deltaproteobacteria bacterium]